MFAFLKSWLDTRPQGVEARAMAAWAKTHGHVFKTVRSERGGVIDCREGARNWRVEWGDSQRTYIQGAELRLREDLGVSQDFQLLLLSRTLGTQLETDVFDRFTEAMQTQIDHTMPEEMRWLAMFPRVQTGDNKALKVRFTLQSPNDQAAQAWVGGEMPQALMHAAQTFLATDPPFVIMLLRGKLYLRMQSLKIDDALLNGVNALFALASSRAKAIGAHMGDLSTLSGMSNSTGWGSSTVSTWNTQTPSELPADPLDPQTRNLAEHR